MKTHRNTQTEIRAKAAKRRKRVASLKKQGMPQRQIGRELGCSEKTVRSDLKRLRLAAEQDAAGGCEDIKKPAFAELLKGGKQQPQPCMDRHAKQKETTFRTQQHVPEETPTHIESNTLATGLLNWSLMKGFHARNEFAIFKAVEPFLSESSGREGAACEDPEAVFESIERGRPVPTREPEALKFYTEVLAEALPKLAPDPEVRYWAIQKAMAELVMFIRDPGGIGS
jgi:hypothetical protein